MINWIAGNIHQNKDAFVMLLMKAQVNHWSAIYDIGVQRYIVKKNILQKRNDMFYFPILFVDRSLTYTLKIAHSFYLVYILKSFKS